MTEAIPRTSFRFPFISQVRMKNFRSVAQAEVNLAPLTLLVGENSSGKSTLLSALRLSSIIGPDLNHIDEFDDPGILHKRAGHHDQVSLGLDIRGTKAGTWELDLDWCPGRESGVTNDADENNVASSFLAAVRHIGPLRQLEGDTRKTGLYPLSSSVGDKGELTAGILLDQGDEVTGLPLPENIAMKKSDVLRSWVAHLELVEDVKARRPDKSDPFSSFERHSVLEVRPHGLDCFLPLSSVGVGVSQVLPVLVECLMADPGNVILLEQPELHLHPALQQRLADFFIAMVRSGRQLIVETHSEYMVSRLRRRIVEDPEDGLLDLAKVVFAERDRETGLTTYRDVELSPYGAIEEWPAGFFDQAAEEERAIIMGGVKKLRKRAVEREQSLARG